METATENSQKKYELAFHIDPDTEETELKNRVEEIAEIIKSGGGIIEVRDPKRIRLSYPIKKRGASYFGLFKFSAEPETIEKINSHIKLLPNFLRHIIMTLPNNLQGMRILGDHRFRPRLKTKSSEEIKTVPIKEKAAESTEKLEQEVEKVIEGL